MALEGNIRVLNFLFNDRSVQIVHKVDRYTDYKDFMWEVQYVNPEQGERSELFGIAIILARPNADSPHRVRNVRVTSSEGLSEQQQTRLYNVIMGSLSSNRTGAQNFDQIVNFARSHLDLWNPTYLAMSIDFRLDAPGSQEDTPIGGGSPGGQSFGHG